MNDWTWKDYLTTSYGHVRDDGDGTITRTWIEWKDDAPIFKKEETHYKPIKVEWTECAKPPSKPLSKLRRIINILTG